MCVNRAVCLCFIWFSSLCLLPHGFSSVLAVFPFKHGQLDQLDVPILYSVVQLFLQHEWKQSMKINEVNMHIGYITYHLIYIYSVGVCVF